MKKLYFAAIAAMVLAGGIFVACNKDENINNTPIVKETHQKVAEAENWITSIGNFLASVVEGHWREKYKDGQLIEKGCYGLGSCKVTIVSDSTNTTISSFDTGLIDGESYDYDVNIILGYKGKDIILTLDRGKTKEENYSRFFYAERINFSRKYIIDDKDVLKKLEAKNPINLEGDYIVYEMNDQKYIIIAQKD